MKTRIYCKIDGKFSIFETESFDVPFAKAQIRNSYNVKGAILHVVKPNNDA